MNNDYDELFDESIKMRIEMKGKEILRQQRLTPLSYFFMVCCGIAFCFGCAIEFEMVYQVFDYLAGEDNQYWSPGIMACGSLMMILGFHVVSDRTAENFASRIIGLFAKLLIPVYVIGAGLLFSAILFRDGLSDLLAVDIPVFMSEERLSTESGWIDLFFEHVTNPLAVIGFALGIGALATVNLFATHYWLSFIKRTLKHIHTIKTDAEQFKRDREIIYASDNQFLKIKQDISNLLLWDDRRIALEVATQSLTQISDALVPHNELLKNHTLHTEKDAFEIEDPVDFKQVEKDIAKIEAISVADILQTLNPVIK